MVSLVFVDWHLGQCILYLGCCIWYMGECICISNKKNMHSPRNCLNVHSLHKLCSKQLLFALVTNISYVVQSLTQFFALPSLTLTHTNMWKSWTSLTRRQPSLILLCESLEHNRRILCQETERKRKILLNNKITNYAFRVFSLGAQTPFSQSFLLRPSSIILLPGLLVLS